MASNTRSLWIIIFGLIILNVLSLASIWFHRDHKSSHNTTFKTRTIDPRHLIPKKLNFTDEQAATFDSLATLHREDLSRTINEMRTLRKQLMDQVDTTDTIRANDLIHQIGEKHKEIEKINFAHFQKVMGLCDEDQKQALKKIMHRVFRERANDIGRHLRKARHRK